MLKKNICKRKVILLAIMVFTLSFAVMPIMFAKALVEEEVLVNIVPPGCQMIDFEEGTDAAVILSTIEGLEFTTTAGQDWIYGDVRRTIPYPYNAHSLTENIGTGAYCLNGFLFAWLGVAQGSGRIDFTLGTASYFSVLTSTYSGLVIDAYNSAGVKIASSERARCNVPYYNTPKFFTRLTVQEEGMAWVILHDAGNQWLIDDLVTDAPGVGGPIEATIDFDPDSLNPKSSGKYVTVYIELPEPFEEYNVSDIEISTIELTSGLGSVFAEDTPTEIGYHDENGIPYLMVKFNRSAVIAILVPGGEREITVSGESWDLNDDFLYRFEGTIDVRVLDFG